MSDDLTFGPDDPPWEPCECVDIIPALQAENERLRKERDATHDHAEKCSAECNALIDRAINAEAEAERLRAVVEAKTFADFWVAVEQVFPTRRHNAELRAEAERLQAIIDRDRELMEADSQEILRLREEAERLRATLARIKRDEGKVCDGYERCSHQACASSYAAWAIADEALNPKEDPK